MKSIILRIIALVAVLIMVFAISACSVGESNSYLTTIVIKKQIEGYDKEVFMVYAPGMNCVDEVMLPSLKSVDENGNDVTFKSGDVVVLEFEGDIYIHQETAQKAFVKQPHKGVLKHSGVDTERTSSGFLVSIPLEMINGKTPASGDKLSIFATAEDAENPEKAGYSAVIAQIKDNKAQIEVKENEFFKFAGCISVGYIKI